MEVFVDNCDRALLLYLDYARLSAKFKKVKKKIECKADGYSDFRKWKRVRENRVQEWSQKINRKLGDKYHISLVRTALIDVLANGDKKRLLKYLNWFVQFQKMPEREPVVRITSIPEHLERDRNWLFLAVDCRFINSDIWRGSYGKIFNDHIRLNDMISAQDEKTTENKERKKEDDFESKPVWKSPRESYADVLSYISKYTLFIDKVILTFGLDDEEMGYLNRVFSRYIAHLSTLKAMGGRRAGVSDPDVYYDITARDPGALGVEEDTFLESLKRARRIINNVEKGHFPGSY